MLVDNPGARSLRYTTAPMARTLRATPPVTGITRILVRMAQTPETKVRPRFLSEFVEKILMHILHQALTEIQVAKNRCL
jgi:hypothetical protein